MKNSFLANASATPPAAPATPSVGYVIDGNPGGGVPATIVGSHAINAVFQELLTVINAASITPDAENNTQLLAALRAIGSPAGLIQPFAGNAAPPGWLGCNGAAVSRTTYAALFAALVTNAGFTPQTFTVTIANPGVFTKSAHGFTDSERLRLSSTGALPTGLNTATDYYVLWIDANTFNLALTPGGAPIVTTGSQSGTHSYTQSLWGLGDGSTTFNVPNLQDAILKGSGSARQVGTWQKGTLNSIDTALPGIWNVNTSASNANLSRAVGLDTYDTATYPTAALSSLTTSGVTALPGSSEAWSGVARPNNMAVLMCVKY
jgi:microcystin-dependent protein